MWSSPAREDAAGDEGLLGAGLGEVATPAVVVDIAALRRNIARVARWARQAGMRLRPHAKTHKCPEIARLQVEEGAVGVCCQTVAEAEAMAAGGSPDVLMTNEAVDEGRLARLARLSRSVAVTVCVDGPQGIARLAKAAARHGAPPIGVLVEIDAGGGRCGAPPGEPALALARLVAAARPLRFDGLQAYNGKAQHLRSAAARRQAAAETALAAARTRDLIVAAGLPCERVCGGGTGTAHADAELGVIDEVQPGSYVFNDLDYGANEWVQGSAFAEIEQSLFVLVRIVSRPRPDRIVVDGGLKAVAFDSGPPALAGIDRARWVGESDEHGIIEVPARFAGVVGDVLRLVPGHCDPTVNLHARLLACEGGRVAGVFSVCARGSW